MEFLAPSYRCLLAIRQSMEAGCSPRDALLVYLKLPQDDFQRSVMRWWLAWERGVRPEPRQFFAVALHVALISTLTRGLLGEPIVARLREIEDEMQFATEDTVERHLQRLPLIILVPLLLFIFPSLMLLVLGPLLLNLTEGLRQ